MPRDYPPARLLAKPDVSLPEHTRSVVSMARVLCEVVGEHLLSAVGLDPGRFLATFQELLLLAALLHDIGKGTNQFYGAVTGKSFQSIRHEAVSYLVAAREPLRSHLIGLVGEERYRLLLWAVAGHHRKFPPQRPNNELFPEKRKWKPAPRDVVMWLGHPDIRETLGEGFPLMEDRVIDLLELGRIYSRDLHRVAFEKEVKLLTEEDVRLLGILKVTLMVADVLGSIRDEKGLPVGPVVEECLRLSVPEGVYDGIVRRRLGDRPMTPLQARISWEPGTVGLVEAGCGSGKTIVAYRYAESAGSRRLFVCYPTIWATEMGFDQYLSGEEMPADYYHHLASLEEAASTWTHDAGEDEDRSPERRILEVFRALRVYASPIVACTHDTLTGVIRCVHSALMCLPAIVQGAVVFDEVQIYSDYEFDALLRFLRWFPGIPTLVMSASLQPRRREQLAEAARAGGRSLATWGDEGERERAGRYRKSSRDLWEAIDETLARSGRVLWISNTVDRCIASYRAGVGRGHEVVCCHGRFRYRDKIRQQARMEAGFSSAGTPFFGVATQVAESSLDLSADLLITDLAAIWAIIQRLGRLNRGEVCEWAGEFIVVPDLTSPFPYGKEEINDAIEFFNRLLEGRISQSDLIRVWRSMEFTPSPGEVVSEDLFRGKFATSSAPTRLNGHQVDLILPEDYEEARQNPGSIPWLKVTAYLPDKLEKEVFNWRVVGHCREVPRNYFRYNPEEGGQWHNL